jgi:hypothetical protein
MAASGFPAAEWLSIEVRYRRNPVVAAHPDKGPFTMPLRTLLIVVATGGV